MNTENVVPHLREEAVNPVGDLLEGGVTTGIKRTAIHGSYKDLRQSSEVSPRIRNRTYGGVRGRELIAPSYSIDKIWKQIRFISIKDLLIVMIF